MINKIQKLSSKYKWFFFISIFMLANGSLFTWLFKGTPLAIWRQMIWFIGLWMMAVFSIELKQNHSYQSLIKMHLFVAYLILISALIAHAEYGYNVVRLAYSFWIYFSGLPFILLPFLIARHKLISVKRFYQIFTVLGIFMTIGLFIDYITDGYFTKMFLLSASDGMEGLLKEERYCFLAEAPTTFGVYYCFCLVCTFMTIRTTTSPIIRLTLFFCTLAYIGASWVTGSRQIVFALVVVEFIGIGYFLFFLPTRKKLFLVLGLLISSAFLPYAFNYIKNQNSFDKRYSQSAIGEDSRSKNWEKGFNETVKNNPRVFLLGHGASYIQGQKSQPGEINGSHYESTIYSRISELGIGGLIFLLVPTIVLISKWKSKSYFFILMGALNIAFLLTCYVSPNGVHQTTQMIMYLSIGMIFFSEDFDISN